MSSLKTQDLKREEGFTLIELLVVVIIIGILAAIAIPTFLNQRERGWQAELTSAVRNGALDVEAEATQTAGTYPAAAPATLAPFFVREGDNMPFTYAQTGSGTGFTLKASHPQINGGVNCVTYDSTLRGLQQFVKTACA